MVAYSHHSCAQGPGSDRWVAMLSHPNPSGSMRIEQRQWTELVVWRHMLEEEPVLDMDHGRGFSRLCWRQQIGLWEDCNNRSSGYPPQVELVVLAVEEPRAGSGWGVESGSTRVVEGKWQISLRGNQAPSIVSIYLSSFPSLPYAAGS